MALSNSSRHNAAEDDLTPELFNKLCKYVYDKARITLGPNKMELVRARFGKVIRQRKMSGFQEYYKWISTDQTGEALREVMNSISTNLTSFFRENDHFVFLSKVLLPELESKPSAKVGGKTRLRGWSAGCSTGEEVYTMTMTIAETVGNLDAWDIKLLATDIDTEVVAHGQLGLYAKERVEGIQAALAKKYFDSCTDAKGKAAYQIKEFLRRLVTFRHLNLFTDWPFKNKFNYIFCRNVMIYFDRHTQEELVNRYHTNLASGGYLFIGHSESLNGINHPFEYIKPTIYRKK